MSSSDGQKIKATDVKLLPQFGAVMQQIAQAKGINIDENADKILDMVEIWSSDALSKPAIPNEKPKKTVKKKTVKKKATATSEEKPKKTTRKKKTDTKT